MAMLTLRRDSLVASRDLQQEWLLVLLVTRVSGVLPVPVVEAGCPTRGVRQGLTQFSSCRANAQQPKLFVGMILILIFAEALALYGLIGTSRPLDLACCLHKGTQDSKQWLRLGRAGALARQRLAWSG